VPVKFFIEKNSAYFRPATQVLQEKMYSNFEKNRCTFYRLEYAYGHRGLGMYDIIFNSTNRRRDNVIKIALN
jgi:hypothetical protein